MKMIDNNGCRRRRRRRRMDHHCGPSVGSFSVDG